MTAPSQPPDPQQQPQQPQWWQPPAAGAAPQPGATQPGATQPGAAQPGAWQPEQQATGPHSGQWQQQHADPGAVSGSYTGQWQPGQPSGSFSGPWQPGQQSGPWQPGQQSEPWQPGQQTEPGQQSGPGQQSAPWQATPSQPTPAQPMAAPGQGAPPQSQYGGGFQPSQYGGLGAFPAEPAKKPKSKKPVLIAGAAVLVLALGGGAAWLLGAFRGDVLDQQSLQDGVVKVLNENYGEPDVKNAQCPANQAAQNGTTFDCTVTIGGQQKKVTVRVLNDRPDYEVGAPH
ncbi:protein of unknown function [Amycolatopsis tolypomycina]|uniref:DUF4333 domain-containing protein n=1 Tax=Amycolatopsis tolypomycina TaxID=208445 RepID=A0A1H4IN10_9PSEU|nr:DUF4333 domain-containing protein [Amycolatopsis tolypomycina]SEB34622.1 protein of unknown function [Amycolatopsis tolypomycina]